LAVTRTDNEQTQPTRLEYPDALSQSEVCDLLDIMAECNRGRDEAFQKLVKAYDPALRSYLRSQVLIYNLCGFVESGSQMYAAATSTADELAHDVWTDVLIRESESRGYDRVHSFYTYLVNVVAMGAVAKVRRQRREGPIEDLPDEEGEPLDGPEPLDDAMLAAFDALFRVLFLCGGYPHQQLAFAYSKVIYGATSKGDRRVEGKSSAVYEEHSDERLNDLASRFWQDFCLRSRASRLDLEETRQSMAPLYCRLEYTASEALARDVQFTGAPDQVLGTSVLKDYYGTVVGPRAISDWCDKVGKRVRAVAEKGAAACGGHRVCSLEPCEEHTRR
jgi:DNA-directed RNA polymerase specialized sigma24 family protein